MLLITRLVCQVPVYFVEIPQRHLSGHLRAVPSTRLCVATTRSVGG